MDLFEFFGLVLLFLRNERSERSILGDFWVCSNSGFVKSMGLFEVWVLFAFFGFVLFLRSE